jgi:hypothetical protein
VCNYQLLKTVFLGRFDECVCVTKVLHEGYFLFAALGFGIMAFGYCLFRKIREIGTQDNGIRNIGISRKCPFQDNDIRVIVFGKRYIREIGIWEIVRQGNLIKNFFLDYYQEKITLINNFLLNKKSFCINKRKHFVILKGNCI